MGYNFEYRNAFSACYFIKEALSSASLETNEKMGAIVNTLKDWAQKNKSKKAFFNAMEKIYFNAEDCQNDADLEALIYDAIKPFFK